jgi:hypothetical protein
MFRPEPVPPGISEERGFHQPSTPDQQSGSSQLRHLRIQVTVADQARGIERVNTDPRPGPPESAVTSPR